MGYTNPRIRSGGALDYVIRVLGIAGTLSAAIVMGLNNQTISLFGVPLKAKYHYTPAFTYFVVANAIVAVYGLISLTFCLCFKAKAPKLCSPKVLFLFDFLMTLLVMSATSAASSVAYIGKKGNSHSGWVAICHQFGKFCDRVVGSLFASFFGTVMFMIFTIMSAGSQ